MLIDVLEWLKICDAWSGAAKKNIYVAIIFYRYFNVPWIGPLCFAAAVRCALLLLFCVGAAAPGFDDDNTNNLVTGLENRGIKACMPTCSATNNKKCKLFFEFRNVECIIIRCFYQMLLSHIKTNSLAFVSLSGFSATIHLNTRPIALPACAW